VSRIPPGKVLVKAGKFEGGKLPNVSYIGQIKPADMSKIIWWGQYGSDTTGDGSVNNPYATFDKALEMFSSTTHKWILRTDLGVYGEPGAGPYIDNPADRVYLDPTRPNDSGNGLTPATAKKTYAAAKAALTSSGRSVIHCIGSFTLSDRIDVRTQGEIGETLTLNNEPDHIFSENNSRAATENITAIQTSTGALIVCGASPDSSAGDACRARITRSNDGGKSWSEITTPWSSVRSYIRGIAEGNGVLIAVGIYQTQNVILRSTDDGVTWSQVTVAGGIAVNYGGCVFSGSNFVIFGKDAGGGFTPRIFTSPDGITWTLRPNVLPEGLSAEAICTDGAGKVMITSAGSIQFSTDHGVTWTYYSNIPGLPMGVNIYACAYAAGKWWIFRETVTNSVYYAANPTTLWTVMPDAVNPMAVSLTTPKVEPHYSASRGGFIVPTTNALTGEILLVNETTATVLTGAASGYYKNYVALVFTYERTEYVLIAGETNARVGKIAVLELSPTNIRADVNNAKMHSAQCLSASNSVQCCNISAAPAIGTAVKSQNRCIFLRSRLISVDGAALVHNGDELKLRRCIVVATNTAAQITGAATTTAGIEIAQSILIGHLTLNNTNGTDKELILDNIIEGDFTAAAPVTVKSNIRGAVVNASGTSKISTINPLFVDDVDYELSRVALGQNVDSPLIKLSASYFYSYNGTIYPDDLGPHRVFAALLQTAYKRAFLLPKFSGDALNEDIENVAALIKSINGVPDVSNQPRGRLEIVSWQSKAVDSSVREFISFMERQRNTQCELYYDFDETALDDIVVNGAHSSGTFELNIQPKDIPVGTVLTLFGQLRYVVQRYPRSGEATKLVLDDVLSGGLADGATIPIAQIQGAGTFVFVPEQRRTNRRIFSRRRDAYAGMKYTFVRKAL
jgi:hypothetical protein